MINKIIFFLLSYFFIIGSFFDFSRGRYQGVYLTLYGIEALVANFVLLFISSVALGNLFLHRVKWLKPTDWPWFALFALLIEFMVHSLGGFVRVFFQALK